MRLVQFISEDGRRRVGLAGQEGMTLQLLEGVEGVYGLAMEAAERSEPLATLIQDKLSNERADYAAIIAGKRLLPPLDHPDPAHCHVTGTGLTHLGSAKARDEMHVKSEDAGSEMTDSMRLFQWGLEGGKPGQGHVSVQPEWFYKGSGNAVVAPEQPLSLPPFALDGGEEAELVGLYVVDKKGTPRRVGFALGNEFSDHVMERQNYLYLAHSKLRPCSFGPEILVGDLPRDIQGNVRILRNGEEIWAAPFLTGEENMAYAIGDLEHHHFKYAEFRRPGDVHCHFFGTATLSFSAGIAAQDGDIFEISAPAFGAALRNSVARDGGTDELVHVESL